jgi:C_GCAxxG_C_C family probable redox protein
MSDSPVADRAERLFRDGANCAQAVLQAVAEGAGLACPACIPAVALGMGGGIAHTGRTCGAATGAVMAIGLAVDRFSSAPAADKKQQAYGLGGDLMRGFEAEFGSAECERIIGLAWTEPDAIRRFKESGVRDTKCVPCVRWAAAEAARAIQPLRAATGRARPESL